MTVAGVLGQLVIRITRCGSRRKGMGFQSGTAVPWNRGFGAEYGHVEK